MRPTLTGGRRRLAVVLLMLPLLACLSGCGAAKVSGKVTYKGEPLHAGTVLFTAANGWTGTGHINEDGTYSIANVPSGTAKVAVDVPSQKGKMPPGGKIKRRPAEGSATATPPSETQPLVKIPPKYKEAATSGLTCEVTGGKQIYNIDLQ